MNSVHVAQIVVALSCTLLPIVACTAAGSAIGATRWRLPGADMLVGFGVLGSALTILATTTSIPLSWIMACLGVVSVIAVAIRRELPGGRATWIALALISPILVVAASEEPALWDDFWNWLPSAAYAYWHNSLPWPDLAPSLSIFPGYPQGLPLMIAAASFIGGRFLEAAGPIINISLLAGSSALFAEALTAALVRQGRLQATETPPVLVAGAVAITILLNPGLDGSVALSSYAECGTMVGLGALGLVGVEILARLPARDSANVEGLAWRFGFVGAMLVNLKQANPVLFALVTIGLALIALRDPALRTKRAMLQLPRMLGPAMIVVAVWHWYVARYLPSNSQQTFRPLGNWYFDALPDMFASIGLYIADAPLFHALMWSVTAAGVVFFFQSPRKTSEARWLAIVCAVVWLGYNVFLLIIFLGAFSVSDAYGAADYWRYTRHVALIGLYAPVMALAIAHWPVWMNLRSPVLAIAAVLVALCALPIRTDLNNPPGRAWQSFLRTAVAEVRPLLPGEPKVVIVSFPFRNSLPFGVAVRYGLWQFDMPEQKIVTNIRWDNRDLAEVARLAARGEVNCLIVQDAQGSIDEATDALGLPRLNHELVLFVWRDGAWARLKSWPVPPSLIHRDL